MTTQNPLKAIRKKCLDCVCFQPNEVLLCPSEECPLHPFRFGKNPYKKKREYTDEQKEKMRKTLEQARAQKTLSNSQ